MWVRLGPFLFFFALIKGVVDYQNKMIKMVCHLYCSSNLRQENFYLIIGRTSLKLNQPWFSILLGNIVR